MPGVDQMGQNEILMELTNASLSPPFTKSLSTIASRWRPAADSPSPDSAPPFHTSPESLHDSC